MKLVVSDRAADYIRDHGGQIWVWLDPHRGLVGSHVWLETHCEPPRSSRLSSFTRSARRPHRFRTLEVDELTVHFDFGRMDPPEELHVDRKGWRKGTHRLESYWNGSIFVGEDVPPPGG
jgi:hypothetical protein